MEGRLIPRVKSSTLCRVALQTGPSQKAQTHARCARKGLRVAQATGAVAVWSMHLPCAHLGLIRCTLAAALQLSSLFADNSDHSDIRFDLPTLPIRLRSFSLPVSDRVHSSEQIPAPKQTDSLLEQSPERRCLTMIGAPFSAPFKPFVPKVVNDRFPPKLLKHIWCFRPKAAFQRHFDKPTTLRPYSCNKAL